MSISFQINLATGKHLDLYGEKQSVSRIISPLESDADYRLRIIAAINHKSLRARNKTAYTPLVGEWFKSSAINADKIYRAITIGAEYIFAFDIQDQTEILCSVDGNWIPASHADLVNSTAAATIRGLIEQADAGVISHSLAIETITGFFRSQQPDISQVVTEVIQERARQVASLGNENEDGYLDGVLSLAGASYAIAGSDCQAGKVVKAKRAWPWHPDHFQMLINGSNRDRLVKAAALIIAEIEAQDRRAAK